MSRSKLRLATADEYRDFYGREPPDIWFAIPHEENGVIVGMGLVVYDAWGRAWGMLDAKKPLSAILMHRTAKRVLAALKTAGEPVLYAGWDSARPDAEKWFRRLGFSIDPTLHPEEMDRDGRKILVRYWSMRLADV